MRSPRLGILSLLLVCCTNSYPAHDAVRPGIDVLVTDSAHLVEGRRVGLVTNQTGVGLDCIGDVEILLGSGVELTAIFSPEHGFRGVSNEANVEHSTDSATGLPIFSLYGDHLEPTPEMLSSIDVILVDLQDIGARTYTYISTALYVMRAAAGIGMQVIILDRPNPIGGELVQGPMLDQAFSSYVGMLSVPIRHGMTLGELALLGNDQLEIGADVVVIPADGWSRELWFDGTGLPWIKPSPNMPDLESATHYPGFVLYEGTNLSVGRGTPIAFQVLGAPWLDPSVILPLLDNEPGVEASDTTITPITPADRKYGGEMLPALKFRVTDSGSYDPVRFAMRVFAALRDTHGESLEIRPGLDRLAGSDSMRNWLDTEVAWETFVSEWESDLEEFLPLRQRYLLYR